MEVLNILKETLFFVALIFATIWDMREREIPDILNVCIFAIGLFGVHPIYAFVCALVTGLPYLIASLLSGGRIGGGDIKLMAACGAVLGIRGGFLQSIIALTLVACYGIAEMILKKDTKVSIPLAPFLGTGGFLSFIIMNYGGI